MLNFFKESASLHANPASIVCIADPNLINLEGQPSYLQACGCQHASSSAATSPTANHDCIAHDLSSALGACTLSSTACWRSQQTRQNSKCLITCALRVAIQPQAATLEAASPCFFRVSNTDEGESCTWSPKSQIARKSHASLFSLSADGCAGLWGSLPSQSGCKLSQTEGDDMPCFEV